MANKKNRIRKGNITEKATPKRRRSVIMKKINISEPYEDIATWTEKMQKDLKGLLLLDLAGLSF